MQAGDGISPLGSLAMLGAAAIDLVGPRLGFKTGPVWGAGEAGCPPRVTAASGVGGCGMHARCLLPLLWHEHHPTALAAPAPRS